MTDLLQGGGRSLGVAQGAIRLNLTDLQQAREEVRRVGQEINRSLGNSGQTIRSVTQDIRSMRGELVAIGAIGGVLTGLGLGTAGSLQEARIQLRGMLGDERQAIALMEQLRQRAEAAGVPFNDFLRASRLLLPTLEGNTEELNRFLDLSRRVATLNQREGLAGAAFAINEAISSGGTDLVSLAERFSIPRAQLREALRETGGDFAAALDIVLTRMGITMQTADEMGQTFNASFRAARDAALQFLGEGFAPFLDTLTQVLREGTSFLTWVRETHPEVATLGASFLGVVAVGAPLLVFLAQVIESLERIRALSIAGTLGRAGAVGLAVAGGVGLGIGASRAIGRATGNEELATAGLDDLSRILRQTLFFVTDQLTKIVVIVADGLRRAEATFRGGIANMVEAMGRFVTRIGQLLPDQFGGRQLQEQGRALIEQSESIRISKEEVDNFTRELISARGRLLEGLGRAILPGFFPGPQPPAEAQARRGLPDLRGGVSGIAESLLRDMFSAETLSAVAGQVAARRQFDEREAALDEGHAERIRGFMEQIREANQEAAAAVRQVNEQLAESLRGLAQDRARAEQQAAADRIEAHEDAAADIRDIETRLAERLEDLRQDALAAEAEYQRRRGQMEEDFATRSADRAYRLNERIEDINERFSRRQRDIQRDIDDMLADVAGPAAQLGVDPERLLSVADQRRLRDLRRRLADEAEERDAAIRDLQEEADREVGIEREKHAEALAELDRRFQQETVRRAEREQELRTEAQRDIARVREREAETIAAINERLAEEQRRLNERQRDLEARARQEIATIRQREADTIAAVRARIAEENEEYAQQRAILERERARMEAEWSIAVSAMAGRTDEWEQALSGLVLELDGLNRKLWETEYRASGAARALDALTGRPTDTTADAPAMIPPGFQGVVGSLNPGIANRLRPGGAAAGPVTVNPTVHLDMRGATFASDVDVERFIERAKREVADEMSQALGRTLARGSSSPSSLVVEVR